MHPISGESEVLTNTQGKPIVANEKEKHHRVQGVKVQLQTLQKMGGQY